MAFIVKASSLLEEREDSSLARWTRCACCGAVAGIVCLLVHLFGEEAGDRLLRAALGTSLAASAAFYLRVVRRDEALRTELPYMDMLWGYLGILLLIPFLTFGNIITDHPLIFTFLIGALPTMALLFAIESQKMARNAAIILRLCVEYNLSHKDGA